MHKGTLAVAALVLGGLAAGGCESPAPKSETYTSDVEGFALTFPSDWTKSTSGRGMNLEILPPDQTDAGVFRDDIIVRVEGLAEVMPLEDFAAVKIAKVAKNVPGYKEITKDAVKVGGQDVRRLIFSYTNPNYDASVTSLTYFLVSGNRGYTVTANAATERFPARKAQFEEILGTFKLLGGPSAAPSAAPAAAPAAGGK
jgi:hypothetical protein